MISYLYHWSPSDRYPLITAHGLQPEKPNTAASGPLHYICASPDPRQAWLLSGALEWCQEIEQWDLWAILVAAGDELHVRPFFGRVIHEVKIRNPIPADRVWWVGRRDNASLPAAVRLPERGV